MSLYDFNCICQFDDNFIASKITNKYVTFMDVICVAWLGIIIVDNVPFDEVWY